MKSILICLSIILCAALSAQAAPVDTTAAEQEIESLRKQAGALEQLFIKVPELVKPSVVTIIPVRIIRTPGYSRPGFGRDQFEDFFNDDFFNRFFRRRGAPQSREPREYRQRGLGSGVIVDSKGYILTNNHVVSEADEIKIRMADGKELDAKIVGTDPKTDLAVVKIEAEGLVAARLGDSDKLKVGSWVIAMGSPLGLEQTVTQGIVSAKGRGNLRLAEYEDFIQTDAAIHPGNSGGPLVNLSGEVVGINTAIAASSPYQWAGFAIPINMAKSIMETLIREGKVVRGWLGVGIQPLTKELAEGLGLDSTEGVIVSQVFEGYPAADAGVKPSDVIVKYNGKEVKDIRHLRSLVASTQVGQDVEMSLIRDGKEITLTAKVVESPAVPPAAEGIDYSSKKLGVTVRKLPPEVAESLGLRPDTRAVIVVNVSADGVAADALRTGDIISEYNKKEISTIQEFAEADQKADLKKGVMLRIRRGQNWFYVVLKR